MKNNRISVGHVLSGALIRDLIDHHNIYNAESSHILSDKLSVRASNNCFVESPYSTRGVKPVLADDTLHPHLTLATKVGMGEFNAYWELPPKTFMVCNTVEVLALPDTISAYFTLNSVLARNGLIMTSEIRLPRGYKGVISVTLYNGLMRHPILIRPLSKIGYLTFLSHT